MVNEHSQAPVTIDKQFATSGTRYVAWTVAADRLMQSNIAATGSITRYNLLCNAV